MRTLAARRLVLQPGEVAALTARLRLRLPPGFEAPPTTTPWSLISGDDVHPSLAAGLRATCAPRVAVLVATTLGGCEGAFGIADDLGGSLLRTADSDVEVSAWPAVRLGDELARAAPTLPELDRPTLHLPLAELPDAPELAGIVVGTLRATVVAPPYVIGQVLWLATDAGWLALEPAEVRRGARWATVRPVGPRDLGAAVAPFLAAALA